MKNRRIITIIVFCLLISISFAATKQEAIDALTIAKQDIKDMIELNIPVVSVNDSLTEAQKAFERAEFADLIKNNATGELADIAKVALEGLDYNGFSYNDVLDHTIEIAYKKKQAISIIDSFKIIELKISEYKEQDIDTSSAEDKLIIAKSDFDKERFSEVEDNIQEIHSILEDKKAEQTKFRLLVKSSKSFFQKNWKEVVILLVICIIISSVLFKRYKRKLLKNELKKLHSEEKALVKLIKKTQKERFHQDKLSRFIYHIRMDKYTKRLNEVRENIPVIKQTLKKKK